MGKLREQMARDMALKGFSPRTQACYLSCVKDFVRHFGRSPDGMGAEGIRSYLHGLIQEQRVSRSRVAQAYSALKFFYTTTLARGWEMAKIPRIKRQKNRLTGVDPRRCPHCGTGRMVTREILFPQGNKSPLKQEVVYA